MKRFALALLFALFPTLAFGQAVNWGDYQDSNQTIYLYFSTVGSTGAAITLVGGTVEIYEDGSATQITTAETLDNDFDSVTGFHQIAVDLNDSGFETGKTYTVIATGGTADSVAIAGRVLGVFSVGRYASATDIKSSVVGATTTEPTSPPAATASLEAKINWIFLTLRNKKTVTPSLIQWFADDATTVVGDADINPNSNTEVTQAEAAAP